MSDGRMKWVLYAAQQKRRLPTCVYKDELGLPCETLAHQRKESCKVFPEEDLSIDAQKEIAAVNAWRLYVSMPMACMCEWV
mmetsp:Transcript_31228/g.61646  ORF Transcript_31228/g.61646 Transcript_31228/m.61646 type:complete len:81 (+) Transcript_31228:427-669(+)